MVKRKTKSNKDQKNTIWYKYLEENHNILNNTLNGHVLFIYLQSNTKGEVLRKLSIKPCSGAGL